jgi:hypothetical protein
MLRDTPLPFTIKTSRLTGSRDIGVKKVLLAVDWSAGTDRQKVLTTADAIAEKVVEVNTLTDLVGVWATLIPRRQICVTEPGGYSPSGF